MGFMYIHPEVSVTDPCGKMTEMDQFWPDMIFLHGEDEVLNELPLEPRKINIRLTETSLPPDKLILSARVCPKVLLSSGQVGNVITNRNANRLEFERLLDGAKTYMRHHKVPGGMKRRVLRWYDYSWSRGRIQGGGDINTALGLLPDKLKTELALHVNLSVLKKVTIFQECQPEFLHDLVLKMKAYIFTPGDLICRKGEVAREMFIIADGILEVMSETGRVLTTMKAGDFFGEIGILNLDGLNKRTADVRSVGYSELFSLSREDVLAAMKDYPEAQEILQSLGRKRLMEARNVNKPRSGSAPHSNKGGSTRDGAGLKYGSSADVDNKAGKRIVEKLRSDVKGIKNALRKSRRSVRMKEEALELQPLNPGSVETYRHDQPSCSYSSGKGMLRRMSRVRSDENGSQEDYHDEQSCEPIGAGLPLIQRLRILKEKTSREESVRPQVSPTSLPNSTILSPPKIRVNKPKEGEVIGAGLPLIQRLLLLKQREEKEKEVLQLTPLSKVDVLSSPVSKSQVALDGQTPDSIVSLPLTKTDTLNEESRISSLKEHHEDESYTTNRKTSSILTSLDSSNTSRVGTNSVDGSDYQLDPTNLTRSHSEASAMEYVRSQQLSRDAFHRASSEAGGKKDHSPHIPTRPIDLPSTVLRKLAQQPLISPESNETVERRNLKSILKKLSASNLLSGSSEESEDKRNTSIDSSESSPDITLITKTTPAEIRKLMRAPTLEGYAARHSKLAKSVTFNRNTLQSPPSTATTPTSISDESTTLMFPLLNTNATEIEMSDKSTTTATCADVSITTTTSITSSSVLASTMAITTSVQQDSFSSKTTYKPTPYMPLCSSPSVESISTTSITTVNDISPFSCNIPMLVTTTNASCQTLPYCKTASMGSNDEIRTTPSSNASPVTTPSVQETQKKPPVSFLMHHSPLIFSSNQKNMFRPPLLLPSHADYEEEYFGEIITGIKQVIQGHLEEIQSKFQSQFQSLELEVRRRDEIISQLQQRIHELEHPVSKEIDQSEEDCDISDIEDLSDQPFMQRGDSVDTVLASPLRHLPEELNELLPGEGISSRRHLIHRHSWEDHSEEESMEIMDLPRSISPQYVWSDNNSTMVNLGSDSSPDDELSDDETTDQVGEYEGVNNQDWEVQMLAKELERREDMSRLENEVQNLKQVVSSSDLNSLSSSELEILEKLLMSKDRKVRAASRALSLDSDEGWEEKPIHQKIHKSSVRSPPVSSLNRRLSRQHSYSGGGSIENLLQRTNILKNRLLSRGDASSMEVRESQLLNARSLEEQVDPLTGPGQSGPSSSSLSPTCFFPANLMRGLGHLVRHSSSPGQSQTASAESVPTISQSCRDLTPPDV
uniref:Cyclic nucleotide-binding domain-containing protein n=1 Tax=Timema cristinae TaxID=61476 RepID=A0A7R9CUY5_TIMCR|nr:unnamed protein product [Timema cristinae]